MSDSLSASKTSAAHGTILVTDLSQNIIRKYFPNDTKLPDALPQCAIMLYSIKDLCIPDTVAAAVEKLTSYLPKEDSDTFISTLLAMVMLLAEDMCMSAEDCHDKPKSNELVADDIKMEEFDDSELIHISVEQLAIKMFDNLSCILHEHEGVFQDSRTSIKLLEMCFTVLCSQTPKESLPIVVDFLTDYMSTLITYSNEGYLTDNPSQFFQKLLEFVSSLSEQGINPLQAIQTNLPNLFGPFFGVHNHSVSCKLLEYGYLSVCSQHSKNLLSEGLGHLARIWRLFPSLDKVRVQERADIAHARILKLCENVVHDIVQSVLDPDQVNLEKDMTEGECTSDEESVAMPSEEECQHDQSVRILVLLKLLELACAMV